MHLILFTKYRSKIVILLFMIRNVAAKEAVETSFQPVATAPYPETGAPQDADANQWSKAKNKFFLVNFEYWELYIFL